MFIADDGVGFDFNASKNKSLGLKNMMYRVELLKGIIQWNQAGGNGTVVLITVPVQYEM